MPGDSVDKHEIIEKSRKVIEKSSPLSKQVSVRIYALYYHTV